MITLHEIVRQFPKELQKPEFYDPMVKEYFHHHILKTLFTGKFASRISFIGGTALRLFYDLKRFSEDIDLDCGDLSKSQFLEMTGRILYELQALGVEVVIEDKSRYDALKAFRRVFVFPELKYRLGISQQKEAKFFIKVEAESQHYEYQCDIKMINRFGVNAPIRTMPQNLLFSTKIAAALNRRKDRDFYDVVFMIDFARPDFNFLSQRCRIESNDQLRNALINAANDRKLSTRKIFDCEHMLFDKSEISRIRSFSEYVVHHEFRHLRG